MFGIGRANGKFGELLQGELPGEDSHFLVTVPISIFSIARFYYSTIDKNKNITVSPHDKVKSELLVKKILAYFGLSNGWSLKISSQIPVGKGLGSSTADLVACTRAITRAIQKEIPIEVLLKFLKEIEPSDGIMYDGIVCFYHRKVFLHSQLGYLPDLMIAGADEGGAIDTIKFNQESRPYTSKEKDEYTLLLDQMVTAIKKSDLKKMGSISTKSALLHQKINPKKNLDFMMETCNAIKALGVIVAHSGTYIGIILDKNNHNYPYQLAFIENQMKINFLRMEKFIPFSTRIEYPLQNENLDRIGDV